jgi:hypothetical protein
VEVATDVGHGDRAGTRRFAPIQIGVFAVSLVLFAWSLAGLIAHPDFATGAAATSKQVLGIDFNGWHALSGFALFGPGLVFAWWREWAFRYALAAIVALMASAAYILVDSRPAGLLALDHNGADALLHFGSGVAYCIVVAVDRLRGRAPAHPST